MFFGDNNKNKSAHEKGQWAEQLAADYICQQGFRIIERNYHCRYGEIDIIARDRMQLLFIEVRFRSTRSFGGSVESINAQKISRLRASAKHFLMSYPNLPEYCRYDVIAIQSDTRDVPNIDWIHNAF